MEHLQHTNPETIIWYLDRTPSLGFRRSTLGDYAQEFFPGHSFEAAIFRYYNGMEIVPNIYYSLREGIDAELEPTEKWLKMFGYAPGYDLDEVTDDFIFCNMRDSGVVIVSNRPGHY